MNQPPIHRIEDILDECVTTLHTKNLSLSDCLARYPENRPELEPLLQTAVQLKAAQALTISPEFRHVAVTRMHNLIAAREKPVLELQVAAVVPLWTRLNQVLSFRMWRTVTAVFVVIIFSWLFIGNQVVSASQSAFPGAPLYPIKRSVEATQLTLTTSAAKKADLYLQFAQERLNELEIIIQSDDTEAIEKLLADYESQLQSSLDYLATEMALSKTQKETLAAQLIISLKSQQADLSDLLWQATPNLRPAIRESIEVTSSGYQDALTLLSTDPEEKPPLILPILTDTPSPTKTPIPTQTPIPTKPPLPTPPNTPEPPIKPTFPIMPTLDPDWVPELPENCELPADWQDEWPLPPDVCDILTAIPTKLPPLLPTYWPTPPVDATWQPPPDWPEECPIPTEWPAEWPEGCPKPDEWPDEWPDPPAPPEGWPSLPPPPPGDGWTTSPEDLPPPPDDWESPDTDEDGDSSGWGWP